MAGFDIYNDVTPKNVNRKVVAPTIAAMRTALKAKSATSYSDTRLDSMTRRDMLNACRVENVAVAGLVP